MMGTTKFGKAYFQILVDLVESFTVINLPNLWSETMPPICPEVLGCSILDLQIDDEFEILKLWNLYQNQPS